MNNNSNKIYNLTNSKNIHLVPGQIIIIEKLKKEKYDFYEKDAFGSGGGCAIIMTDGSMNWKDEVGRHIVNGSSIILFKNNSPISELTIDIEFEGYIICTSQSYIDNLLIDFSKTYLKSALKDGPVVKAVNSKEVEIFQQYIYLMIDTIASYEDESSQAISKCLGKAFLYRILSKFEAYRRDEIRDHKDRISREYLRLVDIYGSTNRNLDFYAEKMCVSKKYLSATVSKQTGKDSHYWVEEATMSKARYMLKSTMMTIFQISDSLNFTTPGDFSRFFRRNSGMTPLQFRKS